MADKKFCYYLNKNIQINKVRGGSFNIYVCEESDDKKQDNPCKNKKCCYNLFPASAFMLGYAIDHTMYNLTIDGYVLFITSRLGVSDFCKKKWYQIWK